MFLKILYFDLVKLKLFNIMGISGKYENEDRRWLSEYLPKEQNELPPRSMNVSVYSKS